MNHGSVHGFVHGLVYGLVYGSVHSLVYGTWFMVRGVLHNVLLEHGGLPCIFPLNVHLDFGHHSIDHVLLDHGGLHCVCSLCCPC